ncbi:hypothetical protein RDI58_004404 [Solanum bulbocastanum]|uniref:Uncharacterized protein n=1 Tax=Solanum bulbocastanum TaxID=147425 RepID=A0AAN8U5I2_SOLBU
MEPAPPDQLVTSCIPPVDLVTNTHSAESIVPTQEEEFSDVFYGSPNPASEQDEDMPGSAVSRPTIEKGTDMLPNVVNFEPIST